jgi:tetratricopeptide (TPR) repeat protein
MTGPLEKNAVQGHAMAFSDVKISYYQSMFRIRSRRFLVFAGVIQIACVLPSIGAAQVANSQIQAQVQEHFLAAQQAQQRGQLNDAVAEYQQVVRLQPRLPEVYANLGLVYYALGEFENSAKALASAEKLRPGMRGVSLWLGIDEVKLNHPAQGVSHLREAIRLDPKEKLAQSWLGIALWDAGQIDAALLQLRTAAVQFPNDPDFLFAAGEAYGKAVHQQTGDLLEASRGTALSDRIYADVYVQERDWTKAEGHLRRAIQRDPRSVDARLELANVFFRQARFSDALELLDQAAAIQPHSAAVLARSGEILILFDHPADGLSRIERALAIDRSEALDALGLPLQDEIEQADPKGPDAQLIRSCRESAAMLETDPSTTPAKFAVLAALYALAGDRDAAAQAYRQIAASKPAPAPAGDALDRALIGFHQHDYEQAEDALERWVTAHPADLAARYDLLLTRRYLSMRQIFRLVAVAPDSYHVHQLLGQLYADHDEDKKAIDEYLLVAAARPDLPGVHFWLGHLYWKHADADHALPELTRELELDPGNAEANAELGSVLVAEGRAREAIPHLESALSRSPDLWPAYAQLGKAYADERDYAKAKAVLRRALAHDSDGAVHYQFGMVLRSEGKTAQALQAFAQVRAIKEEKDGVASQATLEPTGKP